MTYLDATIINSTLLYYIINKHHYYIRNKYIFTVAYHAYRVHWYGVYKFTIVDTFCDTYPIELLFEF